MAFDTDIMTSPSTVYCNYSYPNEFACLPLKIIKNFTDNSYTTYYVHFISSNVWDVTGKLNACFNSYIEQCKQGCGYYLSSVDFPLGSHSTYFDQSSYEYFHRNWRVISRTSPVDQITRHTFSIAQSYAKSIIYSCEKTTLSENEKLYWGLGVGSAVLLWGGWVAYCKYKDYQYRHLLDKL